MAARCSVTSINRAGSSKTCRVSSPVRMPAVSGARQCRHVHAACSTIRSGPVTRRSVSPLWPGCPPLALPERPRRLPAMRGFFLSPSLKAVSNSSNCPDPAVDEARRSPLKARRSRREVRQPQRQAPPLRCEAPQSPIRFRQGELSLPLLTFQPRPSRQIQTRRKIRQTCGPEHLPSLGVTREEWTAGSACSLRPSTCQLRRRLRMKGARAPLSLQSFQ